MSDNEGIESHDQSVTVFNQNGETYSSRVLRNLAKSPLYKPKRGKDGSPSEKELLTIATTLLAAADERITALEKKALVLNAPLFQSPMLLGDGGEGHNDKSEASWLMKYLTLRNFAGVMVLLVGAIWAVFTWYSADKGAQLTVANQRLKDSETSREQFQKDSAFWKKDADDMRSKLTDQETTHKQAIDKKESELKTAQEQSATLKGRIQELEKQVAGSSVGAPSPPNNATTSNH